MPQSDYHANLRQKVYAEAAEKELAKQKALEAAAEKAHAKQLEEKSRKYRLREEVRQTLTLILLLLNFLLAFFSIIWQMPLH